jgi:hypothetical protein
MEDGIETGNLQTIRPPLPQGLNGAYFCRQMQRSESHELCKFGEDGRVDGRMRRPARSAVDDTMAHDVAWREPAICHVVECRANGRRMIRNDAANPTYVAARELLFAALVRVEDSVFER